MILHRHKNEFNQNSSNIESRLFKFLQLVKSCSCFNRLYTSDYTSSIPDIPDTPGVLYLFCLQIKTTRTLPIKQVLAEPWQHICWINTRNSRAQEKNKCIGCLREFWDQVKSPIHKLSQFPFIHTHLRVHIRISLTKSFKKPVQYYGFKSMGGRNSGSSKYGPDEWQITKRRAQDIENRKHHFPGTTLERNTHQPRIHIATNPEHVYQTIKNSELHTGANKGEP